MTCSRQQIRRGIGKRAERRWQQEAAIGVLRFRASQKLGANCATIASCFHNTDASLDGIHTQVSGMIVMERSIPSKKELRFGLLLLEKNLGESLYR